MPIARDARLILRLAIATCVWKTFAINRGEIDEKTVR